MAQKTIELGTAPDGMDGDDARTAFQKTNDNFTELYQGVGGAQPASPKLAAITASVWAANQLLITTGVDTLAMLVTGATGRALIAAADAAAGRSALGAQALHANLTGLSSVVSGADRLPIFSNNAGALTFLQAGAAGKQLIPAATWDDVRTLIEVTRPYAATTKESGSFDDYVGMGWAPQLYRDSALANSPGTLLAAAQRPSYWYLHNTMYGNTNGNIVQVAYSYSISANDKGSVCWRHRYGGVWGSWQRALTMADGTSSATDSTTGRFLKVGDHGVGGITPSLLETSINAIRTTGFYYANRTGAGILPVDTNGYLTSQVVTNDYAVQTFQPVTTRATYQRHLINNVWSSWRNITTIGHDQNWGANLQGSRSYDTTYTNNSGRMMFVQVFAGATSGVNVGLSIVSGGTSIIGQYSPSAGNYVSVGPVPVAPGATYIVSQRNGTAPINTWAEFT